MTIATIFIDSSAANADLLYTTKFLVGDPVLYIEVEEKKYLFLNALEVDRGKSDAKVDEVICTMDYKPLIDPKKDVYLQIADIFLKEKNITDLLVVDNFSAFYYKEFKDLGYNIEIKRAPLYTARIFKTEEEKNKIKAVMKAVDDSFAVAVQILKDSVIDGNYIRYKGELLTSEFLKRTINIELFKNDCICEEIIIASGNQAVDPHNRGTGLLLANTPIIFDIFPQSMVTKYFGDETRTVIKGKATEEQKKLYNTVLKGQQIGLEMLKPGINGMEVHNAINNYFISEGFVTGNIEGRMQGFFHGTGHGVGLEIHEFPRISSAADEIMKEGYVVTVEPGLYYKDLGGVRIEDTVIITKDGIENLTFTDKFFEIE